MSIRSIRRGFLLVSCLLLLIVVSLLALSESLSCMGVSIMSKREYDSLPPYEYVDLSACLTQNGQCAALDRESSTLFVAIHPGDMDDVSKLPASLVLHHLNYRLCFAPDAAFDNFAQAVSSGHRFPLLAVSDTHHMRYDVVFTALPVISLKTENPPEEFGTRYGDLCMWDATQQDYYCVLTSQVRWHKRGNSTRMFDKASLKLTLERDQTSDPRNLPLAGLGSDDDWILNSMVFDDLKLREKIINTLWNQLQQTTDYKLNMSACQYVEVIVNDDYQGLYLLQRRIDNKYLGEGREQDVILKIFGFPETPGDLSQTFIVKHNPSALSDDEAIGIFMPFYRLLSGEADTLGDDVQFELDWDNWLDVNAFTSIFCTLDNTVHKNTFFLLHPQDEALKLQFVLWDTDMSMGMHWAGNSFEHAPAMFSSAEPALRAESGLLFAQDKRLRAAYMQRYAQLRQGLLSTANLESAILRAHDEITSCGALARDQARWGLLHGESDTLETLLDFIRTRCAWLDAQYLPQ